MASDVESHPPSCRVMIFLAGAIVGGVVGLVVGAILQRRAAGGSAFDGRALTTVIALIALVVAGVALADSERDRGSDADRAESTTTTAKPSGAASTTTTTPDTLASRLVIVPNVSHPPLTRQDAEAAIKRAGLQVSVQTLALANVPPDFVISQNPLPDATASAGSTVTLVVSTPV